MNITKEQEAFLRELWEVCKKHNQFIDGCGCCGSPIMNGLEEVRVNCTYVDEQAASVEVGYRNNATKLFF